MSPSISGQNVTPQVQLGPSRATLAVRNFNQAVSHTLTTPQDYTAQAADHSKFVRRSLLAGADIVVKHVFDPDRPAVTRGACALAALPACVGGAVIGALGYVLFGASAEVTFNYFKSDNYIEKKRRSNQRKAVRASIECLERDLATCFERRLGKAPNPKKDIQYDLTGLSQALDGAQALLASPRARQLKLRDPAKAVRHYLAATDEAAARLDQRNEAGLISTGEEREG